MTVDSGPGASGARLRDIGAYVGLSALTLATTLVLSRSSGADFERFLGAVDPAQVVIGASAAGGIAVVWLRPRFGIRVLRERATLRGMAVAAVLATGFAVSAVIADTVLRYPEDMNVAMPQALAFYPAIGFVAELLFHVLPLALALALLLPFRGRFGTDRLVWLAIALVAALEPTFHVLSEADGLSPLAAFTWVHVYAFSLLQLALLRRYDFVSMLTMRLVYYLYWHITWGVVRLDVLF